VDARTERTFSGTLLVVIGLVFTVLVVGTGLVFGPSLRDQVRQETRPRTLREPIAEGRTRNGESWEAVARYDGTDNCVELRLGDDVLDRACDEPGGEPVRDITVTQVPDGPAVGYGVADEGVPAVNVVLEAGTTITVPVKAGELGFPVGFWAAELPGDERIYEVVPIAQ
jgi:hypothetical protein